MTYFPAPNPTQFSGPALVSGQDLQNAASVDFKGMENAMVANGTTRATATPIRACFNFFATVGASGQILLPKAVPGAWCQIFNAGANTATIIGNVSTDTIDGAASTTLTTANRVATFVCSGAGLWISTLGGAVSS